MRCRLYTDIWTQTWLNCWIHYFTLCSYLIQLGIKEKINLRKTLTKQTSLQHSSKEFQPNNNKESKKRGVCLLYCKPKGLRGWPLTHWGWDKISAKSHMTFSNAFSGMKIYEFNLIFHWSLFLGFESTIFQHWFREWLGADQSTSHYMNQWWLDYQRIYTRPQWVKPLGHSFHNAIVFSGVDDYKCNIHVWNWDNAMNI